MDMALVLHKSWVTIVVMFEDKNSLPKFCACDPSLEAAISFFSSLALVVSRFTTCDSIAYHQLQTRRYNLHAEEILPLSLFLYVGRRREFHMWLPTQPYASFKSHHFQWWAKLSIWLPWSSADGQAIARQSDDQENMENEYFYIQMEQTAGKPGAGATTSEGKCYSYTNVNRTIAWSSSTAGLTFSPVLGVLANFFNSLLSKKTGGMAGAGQVLKIPDHS